MSSPLIQHNPPHPGEVLSDAILEPLRLTITAAAARLKVTRKHLSEVVNGRAAISAEMAVRLELAFGKSAQSWLNQQAAYDLWHLQDKRASFGIERLAA